MRTIAQRASMFSPMLLCSLTSPYDCMRRCSCPLWCIIGFSAERAGQLSCDQWRHFYHVTNHYDVSGGGYGTRAAVMHPLALGHHQNLVSIYNEASSHSSTAYGHVRRYGAATGQKVDVATSRVRIDQAQVSSDGQWVLFLSIPDPRSDSLHSATLQLDFQTPSSSREADLPC